MRIIPFNDEQLREEGKPDTFDNTMRLLISQCPRKLYFFLRGFQSIHKAAYFTFGAAFQEALCEWYHGPIPPADDPLFKEKAQRSFKRALDFWDSEDTEEKEPDTRENLKRIFGDYCLYYQEDSFHMVGSEQGWAWPIPNSDYYMGGSMDGYIMYKDLGPMAFETKCTKNYLINSYVDSWNYSSQIKGYIWYLRQLIGSEVYGALMNLITKKVPGPRSNWTTPRFHRSMVTLSPQEQDEFIESFKWDTEVFELLWSSWRWPKTPNSMECSGGPAKSPCSYKLICDSPLDFRFVDPERFGFKLRDEVWSPWDRKEKN